MTIWYDFWKIFYFTDYIFIIIIYNYVWLYFCGNQLLGIVAAMTLCWNRGIKSGRVLCRECHWNFLKYILSYILQWSIFHINYLLISWFKYQNVYISLSCFEAIATWFVNDTFLIGEAIVTIFDEFKRVKSIKIRRAESQVERERKKEKEKKKRTKEERLLNTFKFKQWRDEQWLTHWFHCFTFPYTFYLTIPLSDTISDWICHAKHMSIKYMNQKMKNWNQSKNFRFKKIKFKKNKLVFFIALI